MRFFDYIWAVISPYTPWTMGNNTVHLLAWSIGMIAPVLFIYGLAFRENKTALLLSLVSSVIAAAIIIWWLVDLNYWMHAPPPTRCSKDHCDNDGEIRLLFTVGTLLIPASLPSLILGPPAFFVALRRLLPRNRPSQVSAR